VQVAGNLPFPFSFHPPPGPSEKRGGELRGLPGAFFFHTYTGGFSSTLFDMGCENTERVFLFFALDLDPYGGPKAQQVPFFWFPTPFRFLLADLNLRLIYFYPFPPIHSARAQDRRLLFSCYFRPGSAFPSFPPLARQLFFFLPVSPVFFPFLFPPLGLVD